MKKSTWLSVLSLVPLVLALLLSGCGKTETGSATPGATAVINNTGSSGNDTGTSTGTGQQPPPADQAPTTPVDPTHHKYEGAALTFTSQTVGYVGGKGFILHTADGGTHWDVQYQGSHDIERFSFPDAKDGFALGSKQTDGQSPTYTLLGTTDGGQHWSALGQVPIKQATDLHFTSATTGTVGNLLTTDGGKTWQTLPVPANTQGAPLFLDASNGWALTGGESENAFHLLHTADGGKNWTDTLTKNTMHPVMYGVLRATSPDDVWALVYGGSGMSQTSYSLFHTTDSGKSWLPVLANGTAGGGPAPGFEPSVTGPRGPGLRPGDLDPVDAQTAYLSGSCPACGLGTITMGYTKDGGKTWTNGPDKWPGADSVLSFVSQKQGWLLINTYQYASVLYETTDGGQSWQQEYAFGTKLPKES